jgi:hypothetical protein
MSSQPSPEAGGTRGGGSAFASDRAARSLLYMAKDGRKQRTRTRYFGDDEIMRNAYENRMRLPANDVVCAHVGKWRGARCVAAGFNPVRWNPLVTNVSRFGVYGINFQDTSVTYRTLVMKVPFAGYGTLMDGADGRGLVFQMTLPPKDFEAMSSPAIREHLHRFMRADDDIPRLHREVHG